MSDSSKYHHGDLRSALLREAADVLESSGPEAITLRGLARALGVSHAAPGYHFENREELLVALSTEGFAQLADTLESALAEADDGDRIERSGRAYVRFALSNPGRYRLMFTLSDSCEHDHPALDAEGGRAYAALLRTAYGPSYELDEASYELGPSELSLWAIVHGAAMLRLDGRTGDGMDDDEFLDLVGDMLQARHP